jgi:hypothetical protein
LKDANLQLKAKLFARKLYNEYKTEIFKRADLHKAAIAHNFTDREFNKLFIDGKVCRVGHGRYSITKYLEKKQEPKPKDYDSWVDWNIKYQSERRRKLKEKKK